MRLRDIVKTAPKLSYEDSLDDHGPIVFRDQGRLVYDREKKEFVRPRRLQRFSGRAQISRRGFLEKLKGVYEDVADFLVEGYRHGKDLVEIGLEHGLPAAVEYEAEVIKGDLRDAKFHILLRYALFRDEMARSMQPQRNYR